MSKFKVGDKVKIRGGQDVEIIHINDVMDLPILCVVTRPAGEITYSFWNADGLLCNMDSLPLSRTVTLYQALVRTSSGRYFTPSDLFSGLDDDGIENWNSGGYEFIRLLTEYPIEVEQ
jgi:hypothetical protein